MESAKTGNAPPQKPKKRPKRARKLPSESRKECHPRLKNQKISRNSRIFPDYNGFFPYSCVPLLYFAPFTLCFGAFLRCFCCVFALSTAVYSSFLLYFAIPSRFFHCFFVVFGSFFSLFSHFFRFLGYLPFLAHDFSAVVFLFYRFSFAFLGVLSPFLPSLLPIAFKKSAASSVSSLSFIRFFACTSAFCTVFLLFHAFFHAIVGICKRKSEKSAVFVHQTAKKRAKSANGSVGRQKTATQDSKKRRCRKAKPPSKGKIDTRSRQHLTKTGVFPPNNLIKGCFDSGKPRMFHMKHSWLLSKVPQSGALCVRIVA